MKERTKGRKEGKERKEGRKHSKWNHCGTAPGFKPPVLDHQCLILASLFQWTEGLEKTSADAVSLEYGCALWGMARSKNQNSSCLHDGDGGKGQLGRVTRVEDETAG